jgi:hypothetical protein
MSILKGMRMMPLVALAALLELSAGSLSVAHEGRFARSGAGSACETLDALLTRLRQETRLHLSALPLPTEMVKQARILYAANPPLGPEPDADAVYFVSIAEAGALLTYLTDGCISTTLFVPPEYSDRLEKALLGTDI